jgi:hypothetical protein
MAPPPSAGLPRLARSLAIFFTVLSSLGLIATVGLFTAAFAPMMTSRFGRPDEGLFMVGWVVLAVAIFLFYAQCFAGLYWVYKAWDWLPPEQRYTKHWRSWITPAQAALFLLIPYFHCYWMFVISLGLCDAFDRMRLVHPTPTRKAAPKGLAIAAGICQILVPMPVGAILWCVFMSKMDRITHEMSAAGARMPYAT